jgi:short-subunit dehydrogenase
MARRKIAGLRILVTGASQGIGRALAEEAARQGARVLASARSEELLAELTQAVRGQGGVLEAVKADITSPADRQAMVDAAQGYFGGLDVLINNAGLGATGQFVEASPERLRTIFEVNFFGLTETTRVFLPMLRRGTTPAILNISSVVARRALPARSEYCASKFAVQGFTEALRAELAKDGIDVLLVNPGLTQTNFSKNMLEQKARVQLDHLRGMTSEQVARYALKALSRGWPEVTLTPAGRALVWFSQIFPGFVDWVLRRKVARTFRDEITARRTEQHEPEHAPMA